MGVKKMIDTMKELKELFKKPCPKKLYHYTNKNAFKGIISNQEMWATHIRFMNDTEEQKLALDLLKKQVPNIFAEKNINIEKLQKNIEHFVFLEMLRKGIYILSFSEKKDDLGQWRGYGSLMPSFCLELDTYKFKSSFVSELKNENIKNKDSFRISDITDYSELNENVFDFLSTDEKKQKFYLLPCIYNHSEQIKLINEVLTDSYKKIEYLDNEKTEKDLAKEIAKRFVFYCPLIKNESFECEAEWRVIILYEKTFNHTKETDSSTDESEENLDESQRAFKESLEDECENIKGFVKLDEQLLSSREGLLCDIPFFKFEIKHQCFTKVLIGSCFDKDVVVNWTFKFLFDKGFNFDSDMNFIEYTKIPYRSWKL